MSEAEPFLDEPDQVAERKSSAEWLQPRLTSVKSIVWSNRVLIASHFAIFAVTSILWGAIFMVVLGPLIQHHPPTATQTPATHSHDHFSTPHKPNHDEAHTDQPHKVGFLEHEVDFLTCGNSVAEAKTLGCKYDILTNHWMPGQCAFDNLSVQEYQADGSWFPYADEERTQLLQVDELGDREFYYTSMRDHIVHCAVLWRRQARAFFDGWKFVDEITADPVHTLHCADFLMSHADGPQYREEAIKVVVGKSGCHVRGN